MGPVKQPGWESRLSGALEAARHKTFQWGVHDCILWSASVVAEMTGTDYAAPFRGTYHTRMGAARVLHQMGLTLPEVVDQYAPRQPITMAKRGDPVSLENENGDKAVGICDGQLSFFVDLQGVKAVKTLSCAHAWGLQ